MLRPMVSHPSSFIPHPSSFILGMIPLWQKPVRPAILATLIRRETTMEGWERKLGIIVPSWNTVMEREIQRMGGETMSVHSMRIPHTADTEEKLLWLGTQAPAAA